MREILFRGKRLDNGEWIEGYYFKHDSAKVCFSSDDPKPKHLIVFDGFCDWGFEPPMQAVEVLPETVGQYTGLKDKNGRPIFEGDILQIAGYGEVIDRCVIGYGIFSPYCYSNKMVGFYLYWKGNKSNKYANLPYWVEIRQAICVGNIHDDPELLNGGI